MEKYSSSERQRCLKFRFGLQIAEVCRGWYTQISTAIEVQQRRKRIGNGPLAEIDYWRERNAAISALYEQLKVKDMSSN